MSLTHTYGLLSMAEQI